MSEQTLTEQQPDNAPEDEKEVSILSTMFLHLDMPEMWASRTIRGELMSEMLRALLRAGILTKDEVSKALDRGEQTIQELVNEMEPKVKYKDEDQIPLRLREAARSYAQKWREDLIDEKP